MAATNHNRITISADDAMLAFYAIRSSIEDLDRLAIRTECSDLKEWREEKWQAYQRIAKALGVKPTLSEMIQKV